MLKYLLPRLLITWILLSFVATVFMWWVAHGEPETVRCVSREADRSVQLDLGPFDSRGNARATAHISSNKPLPAVLWAIETQSTSIRNWDNPAQGPIKRLTAQLTLDSLAVYKNEQQALFPFDGMSGTIGVSVDSTEVHTLTSACIQGTYGFRTLPTVVRPDGHVIIDHVREPWFICMVLGAVGIAWMPLIVFWAKRTVESGTLDLLAALGTAAAIRTFLTQDSQPFTFAALDIALFMPLVLLAVSMLATSARHDRDTPQGRVRQRPLRAVRRKR